MKLVATLQDLRWRQVPQRAIELAEKSADTAQKVRSVLADLPTEGFLQLHYDPDTRRALLNVGDWAESDAIKQWSDAIEPLVGELRVESEAPSSLIDEYPVKLASRSLLTLQMCEKQAADPYLKRMLQYLGFLPGVIPTAPNPIIGTLAGGLLGAGAGYGGGWLAEKLAPETEKWNLRSRLAMLGGAAGAVPGLGMIGTNIGLGLPWYSGKMFDHGQPYTSPEPDFNLRQASYGFDDSKDHPDYSFDSREFNRTLWDDPRVSNRLTPQTRAAASGLVTGAGYLGKNTNIVTPLDMARITAGMGSGYVAGATVGKALGVLLGMPQDVQDKLKNTGVWAGMVANLVPLAFR